MAEREELDGLEDAAMRRPLADAEAARALSLRRSLRLPAEELGEDADGEPDRLSLGDAIRLANESAQHPVGVPFQGPSKRWFVKRPEDGKVVPAADPSKAKATPEDRRAQRQEGRERERAEALARPARAAHSPYAADEKRRKADEAAQAVLGEGATVADLHRSIGAQPGSTVSATWTDGIGAWSPPGLKLEVRHPDFLHCDRKLTVKDDGSLVCKNELFFLKKSARRRDGPQGVPRSGAGDGQPGRRRN